MKNVGFIGLGIMGKPMVENLIKHGCVPAVYDVNQVVVAALQAQGAAYKTPTQMAQTCDIIITMLPDGRVVQEVLFGEGGVTSTTVQKGCIIIDSSSVTPEQSKVCYTRLKALGIGFLDAPVSGGEPKAIDGTLAFMVGGDEDAFDRAVPYFEMMGASAVLVGTSGSGSAAKLANQVIVNLTIAAVSEAMVLASKAGADPERVYQAIRGGLAGSTVLDAKMPMILDRNFAPGGKISINLKDITNVMATAHEIDAPLPLSAQLLEIMHSLKASGSLGEDHSAIVKYFERLAGVTVERGGV